MGKEKEVLREILIIAVDEPRRMHEFQQAVKQAMFYEENQGNFPRLLFTDG